MKREIKDFLAFTRPERIGLMLVLGILLILLFGNMLFYRFYDATEYDFSEFDSEVAAFMDALKTEPEREFRRFDSRPGRAEISMFYFDPNNLPEDKWKQLGLRDWQIKVIKNYEAKGGKFYRKTDLERIYGISAEDYARLEPWIVIRNQASDARFERDSLTTHGRRNVVELNSADSASLLLVSGIGPWTAHNIIKYRERLGGFTNTGQLQEVYRMHPETYERIRTGVSVDSSLVKPGVKINNSRYYELLRHPYIDKPMAYAISSHRQRFGEFKTLSDFRNVEGMSDSLFQRLLPYISLE